MYAYDNIDAALVRERCASFRGQVARRLAGELTEDEFRPLRLMNGLYLQLHAYMLRVAIPYGLLSSRQLRALADIADRHDRGYGHFTTRQNIQFNWVSLKEAPDILDALARVDMHAIQTSGNCVRNVTSDPLGGAAADEDADPRPTAELLRQWSGLHPEFSFLPRKFKIAVTGSSRDRTAVMFHDIGLRLLVNADGETGYRITVGGGMGRTPMVGRELDPFMPEALLLPRLESILRVYNLHGRRDNKYKARIKILIQEKGLEAFREEVDADFRSAVPDDRAMQELRRIREFFAPPVLPPCPDGDAVLDRQRETDAAFSRWVGTNCLPHRDPGHLIVTVTLKPADGAPGDADSARMRALADIADADSRGEIRVSYQQNLVLPHVRKDRVMAIFLRLRELGLADANMGLVTDIVACPGLDYCALATARSIPVARALSRRFADPDLQQRIGPLDIRISGCINACGHHHAGHIGILGLDKGGEENYQITLGGRATMDAAVGVRAGPGLPAAELPDAIGRLVDFYLGNRIGDETFLQAVDRLGVTAFRNALHAG